MSAYAAVRLTVDLTRRRGAAIHARDVVDRFPGTANARIDTAGALSFDMIFPGNLTALVHQLADAGIATDLHAAVSLPVRVYTGAKPDPPEQVREVLHEGPHVWDVQFERNRWVLEANLAGGTLNATIVARNEGMHQIYDSLLTVGLTASGRAPGTV